MLFILPFDHRSTFVKELLNLPYSRLTPAQRKQVVELKQLVWEGFLEAKARYRGKDALAILADEEFGSGILHAAKQNKIPFAVSVEKSGQEVFQFEYGRHFGTHLLKWKPHYVKALVRYHVAHTYDNKLQRARLKTLADFCAKHNIRLLLEVLLTAKGSRVQQAMQMVCEMQNDGIRPALWKLEGLSTVNAWHTLAQVTSIPMIMLGRGESKALVEKWVKTAAKSGVVKGFAIGRTVFFKPLVAYRDRKIDRATAVKTIAANYRHFINLWHKLAPSP